MASSRTRQPSQPLISQRTRNSLLVLAGTLALCAAGYWAYFTFTTMSPPPVASATSDEIVAYLGNDRGLGRLPVQRREQYLVETLQRFSEGDLRRQFNASIGRMSQQQRDAFFNSITDIGRVRLMENARLYNDMKSSSEKAAFIDNVIRNFEGVRSGLAGKGGLDNLGEHFKESMPSRNDEYTKFLITKLSPRERSEARGFVDDVAERYQQINRNPALKRQFDVSKPGGG